MPLTLVVACSFHVLNHHQASFRFIFVTKFASELKHKLAASAHTDSV